MHAQRARGKFHESIAAVAVVCVVLGQWCMQRSCDFWASVGKFHESIAVVAVVCVMFGPMCMQRVRDFWASVGKFHESIAAAAVVCVVFGPMVCGVRARLWRLYFGRAWLNSTFRCGGCCYLCHPVLLAFWATGHFTPSLLRWVDGSQGWPWPSQWALRWNRSTP